MVEVPDPVRWSPPEIVEVPVPCTVRVLDTVREEGLREPDNVISSGISLSLRLKEFPVPEKVILERETLES